MIATKGLPPTQDSVRPFSTPSGDSGWSTWQRTSMADRICPRLREAVRSQTRTTWKKLLWWPLYTEPWGYATYCCNQNAQNAQGNPLNGSQDNVSILPFPFIYTFTQPMSRPLELLFSVLHVSWNFKLIQRWDLIFVRSLVNFFSALA